MLSMVRKEYIEKDSVMTPKRWPRAYDMNVIDRMNFSEKQESIASCDCFCLISCPHALVRTLAEADTLDARHIPTYVQGLQYCNAKAPGLIFSQQ